MSRSFLHLEIHFRQSSRAKVLHLEIVQELICREKRFTPCLLLPMTGLTRRLQRIVGEDSLDVLREQRSLLASECATYIMSAPQWEITRKVPFTNACFECSKLLVEQDWILFIHQFSDWVQHSFHP